MLDGRRDFDFFIGSWTVQHERLRLPLSGSTEWYTFEGTTVMRPILGGFGNLDENELSLPDGKLFAITVRHYNERSRRWSIYWATNRDGLGEIPMIGSFGDDGVGLFYNQENFQGKQIDVRFTWRSLALDACRWEQAFSDDCGETWENNWIMTFKRAGTD